MGTYLEMAQGIVGDVFASAPMKGLIHGGQYVRVTPPTHSAAGETLQAPVLVMLYQFDGHGPMADTLWQPRDRVAMIQQTEMTLFGPPREKDHIMIGTIRYQVLRGWEEAPGLLWHMQVRN